MRKLITSLVAVLLCCTTIFAQFDKRASIGVQAGGNLSSFRTPATYINLLPYWDKLGFEGGLFIDKPLSRHFAIQPEFLYSEMGSKAIAIVDERLLRFSYFSVPVLIKYSPFKTQNFSFIAGPQADFLIRGREHNYLGNFTITDRTQEFDFAVTAGVSGWLSYRWGVEARYIHGIKDVSTDNDVTTAYNEAFQASLKFRIGKIGKKKLPPPPPPVVEVPKDSDGDGITDDQDKCPTVAGTAKYEGCPIPDTDKDGINDEEDKCPTVAGTAKYAGCPIPDTDGDGVNDEMDKCPTVAGLPRYNGCPIPDTDGDGVNDEMDKCPNLAGTAANNGCPEIKEDVKKKVSVAAKNILFPTGKSKLVTSSNKGLNDVAKILADNPDMKLAIDGHTDNTGKADKNQTLSEDRANAVKAYFVSKGIAESRITAAGHGQDQPIADNKTAAGRQKNRRVELTLNYY